MKELQKMELILDYEDFKIYKKGRQYLLFDENNNGLKVKLVKRAVETDNLTDDKLFDLCKDYDYSGEELNSTDYLFFKAIPKNSKEIKQLTNEEYNVLGLLSSRSKMDCWFDIITKKNKDYVHDLEYDTILSLKNGISIFNDGLTDLDDYKLSKKEKNCYLNLIKRLGI